MKRIDGRRADQLREINIERNFIKQAEGSCLISMGNTKVICTASIDKAVPQFLKGTGCGWVTSEYGMLPRSTGTRMMRERNKLSGRTVEIQRLVGRVLRSVVDTKLLEERTIYLDCDVIQADGGTRVASIIGGYVSLVDCLNNLYKQAAISQVCLTGIVGAISVGVIKGVPVLDLNYKEDSKAEVDMNVVMNEKQEFVEIQGTAERSTFSRKQLDELLALAKKGIDEIIEIERNLFKDILKI